jgi:Protein of unknown function (DUF2505)
MPLTGDQTYAAAVDDVMALFADPEVVRARYEAAGDRDIEILECGPQDRPNGEGFVIRTSRTVDVDVPSFARKVLKPTNTMIQTDTWGARDVDGARDGDFDIEVKGAPVHVSGEMRIEPTNDGGTRHTVDGKLDVKIPLIGGKVANWAEGPSQQRLDAEYAFHRQRLSS